MWHEDVFISFAEEDASVVKAICEVLEAKGIPCWIFRRNQVPGSLYLDAQMAALRNARVVVVGLSRNSVESTAVYDELELATKLRIPVIPFRIDGVEPTGRMKRLIGKLHWQDFTGQPLRKSCELLAKAVSENLGVPEITFIQHLAGREEHLLESSFRCYEALIPDEAERDDPDDIREWMEEAQYAPSRGVPWR